MRTRRRRIHPGVYIVLGVLLLLTPVVLTQVKNAQQARQAEVYSQTVARMGSAQRDRMLAEARAYNAQLGDEVALDPWTHAPDESSPQYRRYLRELDVDGAMARLRVPSVGIDLPVQHGTSQRTLASGVGHLYGSALPVGGAGTHAVLTGHTGLATLTMFDNLTHVRTGDVFQVEVLGQTLSYRVDQITVVLPTQLDAIRPQAGKDLVTLVTCTPYGINTHRLLVRGTRIPNPGTAQLQRHHSVWQPWMVGAVLVSVLALAYLLWWARRRRRDAPRPEDTTTATHDTTRGGSR